MGKPGVRPDCGATYCGGCAPAPDTLREALEYVVAWAGDGEHPWWIDCPDRGGLDVGRLTEALAAAPAEHSGTHHPGQPDSCPACFPAKPAEGA